MPTSTTSTSVLPVTPINVSDSYNTLRDSGINTRSYAMQVQTATSGTSSANSTLVLGLLGAAVNTLTIANSIVSNSTLVSSLVSYTQMQVGDPTLNVQSALQTSMTALSGLIDAVMKDYPQDNKGFLLDRTFNPNGTISPISLSSGSLSNTLPAISNWLITII